MGIGLDDMKKMILTIFISLSLLLYNMLLQSERILLANEIVPVYKSIDDALASNQPPKLTELKLNQRVHLIKCIDVKHYYIYKVKLDNGTVGFINEGDITLLSNDNPIHC